MRAGPSSAIDGEIRQGARSGVAGSTPLLRYALAALLLVLATPAGAVLIERDLFSPGDALITLDTDTGLEWLDATQTLNLSINDVLGGAGGWTAAGWRHATIAEVCSLFAAVGTAPAPCPGYGYLPGLSAQPILELLGVTRTGIGSQYAVEQLWAWIDSPAGVELSLDRHLTTGEFRTFVAIEAGANPDASVSYYGNLLVQIPEPGAALLCLVAFLAGLRRPRRFDRSG